MPSARRASVAASDAILREHCRAIGRDPDEIERTVNLNVVVRSDRAEAERAWAGYVATHHPRVGEGRLLVGGPVEAVADALAGYAAVGIRHPILIFRSPWDLETIRSLGAIRRGRWRSPRRLTVAGSDGPDCVRRAWATAGQGGRQHRKRAHLNVRERGSQPANAAQRRQARQPRRRLAPGVDHHVLDERVVLEGVLASRPCPSRTA